VRTLILIPVLLVSLACQAVFRAAQPELQPAYTVALSSTPKVTALPIQTSTATASATVTLPPPTVAPSATPTTRPTPSPQHVKIFGQVWEIVYEDYLYPDFNGLDWQAIHSEYLQRIKTGLSEAEFYTMMEEMIYRLDDDHDEITLDTDPVIKSALETFDQSIRRE